MEPSPDRKWTELVERARRGDAAAVESLYELFSQGVRFHLCRSVPRQDLEDRVHDCFIAVLAAIRHGRLREPERLMGFIKTIVQRNVAAHIGEAVQERRHEPASPHLIDWQRNPEQVAVAQQQQDLAQAALCRVAPRDRELLVRFYLENESREQICASMGLTFDQFRMAKCRAKARFGQIGKRRLGPARQSRGGPPLETRRVA
jgi:RNA polymerase sigma-70 factor, ECF subfamily